MYLTVTHFSSPGKKKKQKLHAFPHAFQWLYQFFNTLYIASLLNDPKRINNAFMSTLQLVVFHIDCFCHTYYHFGPPSCLWHNLKSERAFIIFFFYLCMFVLSSQFYFMKAYLLKY